jgi:Protein of unknown function (DUF3810)
MLKMLLRRRRLLLLLTIVALLKFFSLQAHGVEQIYTYGLYPVLSHIVRLLTGWLPFSLGDILYFVAGIGLIRFAWRSIAASRKYGFKKTAPSILYTSVCTLLLVYIAFNVLWGLNYDREGIAKQLDLHVRPYKLPDVIQLTEHLQTQLNLFAAQQDTIKRNELNTNRQLFQKAISVYDTAATTFPYLRYSHPSIKPSLYTYVGQYFGFTGYYNPFSGEAQIKTNIPVFLKPFVATHEIAHQLGYAKENEANFVAFLSSRQSHDPEILYSLYYELYAYSVREVYSRDSTRAKEFKKSLHPQVLRDNEILKAYFIRTENLVEPIISRFYNQYLKWNNQKNGVETYNDVVALLIAYGKKYGWQAI